MYCKEKWCTAGGKGPLFGRVDGFQIGPRYRKGDSDAQWKKELICLIREIGFPPEKWFRFTSYHHNGGNSTRKKLVCLLLALVIAVSVCAAAFADDADNISEIALLEKISAQEQIYINRQLSALLKELLKNAGQ